MRESIVAVVSFVLVSTALSGCGFEDEGIVDLERGQCATQPGTISVVPNEKTSSAYRIEAFCEETNVLAGLCAEPWLPLGRGITVEGVCYSDDWLALVSVSLPQGGLVEASESVQFQIFPYAEDPELAFKQGYTLEMGRSLSRTVPILVRIRTLPREE